MEMTIEQQRAIALANARLRVQPAQAVAPPPDQYQQAAIDERKNLQTNGVDPDAGLARIGIQGATFNTADEILAGMQTPLEMIRRGTFDPREGYKYAKAREDLSLSEGRKKAGFAGTAADIAGGVLTGSGLARGGITAARMLAPEAGVAARSLATGADAAGMGLVAGAAEGNSLEERAKNAAMGGAIGAAAGGATPGVLKVLGAAASPVLSNFRARVNPEGYARSQVARAIMESSRTPQQIADDVAQAAAEGQGVYTVADAMGIPGQRMLSTTTRAPGPGRTEAVEFLDARQAGQGRRIANALTEGFESPQTAAQTEARMTAARNARADREYGAVRNDAGRVDVVGTLDHIDRIIGTGPGQQLQAANDSIEGVLRGFRERLARVNPDDFAAVQRIRGEMSDAAQNAAQNGYGNRARLIRGAVGQIDTAMENASAGHLQANRNFSRASGNIEAINTGRSAALRGRPEDTIPAFRALPAEGQQAYRTGYVDPLIEQAQGAAFGANKARPLMNDAFREEAAAMAPMRLGNQMQRRIARENTMFETRNHATGNSRTADNLADQGAMGVDPTLIGNVLSGNWSGAARGALSAGQNALTGNTPAVRQEVARLLTMRGGNVTPTQMHDILDQAVRRVRAIQMVASQLGRGASGAVAVAPQR